MNEVEEIKTIIDNWVAAIQQKKMNGGEKQPWGWVKDRYGVSWQIVPDFLWKMDEDDDKDRSQRVMKALYKMNKIDIEKLKEVWDLQ